MKGSLKKYRIGLGCYVVGCLFGQVIGYAKYFPAQHLFILQTSHVPVKPERRKEGKILKKYYLSQDLFDATAVTIASFKDYQTIEHTAAELAAIYRKHYIEDGFETDLIDVALLPLTGAILKFSVN